MVDELFLVNGIVKEFEDFLEESESDFIFDGKVKVKWNGFIDYESGIFYYEIFFGRNCFRNLFYLLYNEFNDLFIIERWMSIELFEWFSFFDMGYYIFIVILFNNVLELLVVSCFDGIVYEKLLDLLVNVLLKSFNVEEGIVCFDGMFWLIIENMKCIKLGFY